MAAMAAPARFLLRILLALGLSAVATWGLGLFWVAIGGGQMPVHGWIAMGLGVTGTVVLAWGLMALAFKSDREGWDDQVDNSLDPALKEQEPDDDLRY
jgi:hypothetical protein